MMFFYDIQIHLFVRSASNKVESRKSPTIFWQQRFKRAQSGRYQLQQNFLALHKKFIYRRFCTQQGWRQTSDCAAYLDRQVQLAWLSWIFPAR